jgi:hypothetical protein
MLRPSTIGAITRTFNLPTAAVGMVTLAFADSALTRLWTVFKRYRREPDRQPFWREVNCAENNNHVEIGRENYMLSADGLLMPTRKDQPAPDLRYFVQSRN